MNEKVDCILRDLELLNLIRLEKEIQEENTNDIDWSMYKGAMTKQSLHEVDQQLDKLRKEWR